MRAVVVHGPAQLSIETVPDPAPATGQVVLAVARCGLCGTDRHILGGDNPFARYPVILGHEFSGQVVAVGAGVSRLSVGDRVAVDPSYFCGSCEQCRAGYPNLCPFKGGYGTAKNGGLADYVAVSEASCEPLADGVSFESAALAEPLSCVLHGMDNLGPVLGDDVLVFGAGPIGLMAVSLLSHAGARTVTVVEPGRTRLDAAKAFGADATAASAAELDPAGRYHAVVDATGSVAAMADGFSRIRSGGRFLILGVARPDAKLEISPFDINWRELRIIGSMAVRHSFGRAVRMLDSPMLDTDRLVTSRLPLDRVGDALAGLGGSDELKVQLDPSLVQP